MVGSADLARMTGTVVTSTSNGAGSPQLKAELSETERLEVLQACEAAYYDVLNGEISMSETLACAQNIADIGLFSLTHTAKLVSMDVRTLKKRGVVQHSKKPGGAFNPARLHHLTYSLKMRVETGRYSAEHIKLAYEGGISAPMIARLIGCTAKYVLTLVRSADDYDRRTEELVSAGEHDSPGLEAEIFRFVYEDPVPSESGTWDRTGSEHAERSNRAGQPAAGHQGPDRPDTEPGAAEHTGRCGERADRGLLSGGAARERYPSAFA